MIATKRNKECLGSHTSKQLGHRASRKNWCSLSCHPPTGALGVKPLSPLLLQHTFSFPRGENFGVPVLFVTGNQALGAWWKGIFLFGVSCVLNTAVLQERGRAARQGCNCAAHTPSGPPCPPPQPSVHICRQPLRASHSQGCLHCLQSW